MSKEFEVKDGRNKEEKIIAEMEKKYPEMSNGFRKIQEEDYKMFMLKQHDYGTRNIAMGTDLTNEEDVKLSLKGIVVRVNDKIQRLINLVLINDSEPANESLMDAFADSSVYGVIARLVERGKWGK